MRCECCFRNGQKRRRLLFAAAATEPWTGPAYARRVPRADIGSPVLIDWNHERLPLLRNQEVNGFGPGRRVGIADGMHALIGI
jgi:hypothetical protein